MNKTPIARNFKKLRMFKSMNQNEFAEFFDISRASIGSYEEGRAEPKLDLLIKIADHFKIKVDDIIRGDLTVNKIARFQLPEESTKDLESIYMKIDQLTKKIDALDRYIKQSEKK